MIGTSSYCLLLDLKKIKRRREKKENDNEPEIYKVNDDKWVIGNVRKTLVVMAAASSSDL